MIASLDHINLSVGNFEETVAWYSRVFGFSLVESGTYQGQPWGIIKAGDAMLCIYEHPKRAHLDGDELSRRKLHGVNHFALKVTDRSSWQKKVQAEGLQINYGGPVNWPHSMSWYINDPTGYEIEVVSWNCGKPDFSSLDA